MTKTMPMPRYVINPAMHGPSWTGDPAGFRAFKNPNWLNSVWLGTVWHFMVLPQRFGRQVVRPLLQLQLARALFGVVAFIVMTVALLTVGLLGRLVMLPYTEDFLSESMVLSEELAANSPQEFPVVRIR